MEINAAKFFEMSLFKKAKTLSEETGYLTRQDYGETCAKLYLHLFWKSEQKNNFMGEH